MSETTDLLVAAEPAAPESSPAAAAPDGADAAGTANGSAARSRRRGAGLAAMVLPELQALAAQLGITGTARMRKSQLLDAIREHQEGVSGAPARAAQTAGAVQAPAETRAPGTASALDAGTAPASAVLAERLAPVSTPPAPVSAPPVPADDPAPSATADPASQVAPEVARQAPAPDAGQQPSGPEVTREAPPSSGGETAGQAPSSVERPASGEESRQAPGGESRNGRPERDRPQRGEREQGQQTQRSDRDNRDRDRQGGQQSRQGQGQAAPGQNQPQAGGDDDEFDGRGRRRRGRYRDRNRRRGTEGAGAGMSDVDTDVADDDVLVPVAGILDVHDSYAFVRTSGYLPGANDVYVSLAQVRKSGLRKGDAITGAVKAPRDGGERKEKFNALVRLDTVNGSDPEQSRGRTEFGKLTPLYPQERLRLETEPNVLTTRIIDLVAPIGKGQRGLIVSPPKAGKTMVLQSIANAITTNNPETHLMVVLVDERPEEVTDMQRSVKGEVIASTFDRPAEDHTIVAELAIERAKRLVELGHDVVILLDSITRLGRAYNLAAPASGRILSGGVDSTALYPPKRFFGAARNIENGGSLTILATALVETGSRMDEVIFEEFKGTGNMELKLDRKLADKRIFPAVDVDASGTRKEEILMARDELAVVWKLRRVLSALEQQQSIELMIDKLKHTRSNVEFLMQVQKTSPGGASED